MSDKLLLLFRTQVVGTYTATDTIIELTDASRLVGQVPLNLNVYDRTLGTSVDAYEANKFETWRVTSVSGNTVNVIRGQEGTIPIVIDASTWEVYQAVNPKTITDKTDVVTNGSPTTFSAGTKGERRVDEYYLYECVSANVWSRTVKDLTLEPAYVLDALEAGFEINDYLGTLEILEANQ